MSIESTRRAFVLALPFLGGGLILLSGFLLLGTFLGDSTIYLPYARNIASGDFFAYTPGEFSSGSTSPLWAVIMSIPYLLGLGHVGAKVLAILATFGAFAVVLYATRHFVKGLGSAALAALYLVEMMTLYGVLMYESPLVVALVALSLVAGDRVAKRWRENGAADFRSLLPLILIWAGLPLSRPDATALVALQVVALWLGPGRRSGGAAMQLIAAGAIAAIPMALYYGYSYATLGVFSVSSAGRAFALKERAMTIGPIAFSKESLAYLVSILYALVLAFVGYDRLRQREEDRWVAIYAVGGLILYPFLLIFVQPVTNDLARYFLPIAPFIVLGAASIFSRWSEPDCHKAWPLSLAIVLLCFLVKPTIVVLGEALDYRERGYTFEEITEREAAEMINGIARPGDQVLTYEVQDRYWLRDDIRLLSLDGITDGKVVPYLESGDMRGFILDHSPEYWLANGAVFYRPYLRGSMLFDVIEAFESDTTLKKTEVGGIGFELLARRDRPMPTWFAGWTHLFRLTYGD